MSDRARRTRSSTMWPVTLVLSQPAAEIPFGVTVAVWVIGERILSFRDLRSGAWKSRQDAGSFLSVTAGVFVGFLASLALASGHALSLPAPVLWVAVGLIIAWAGMLLRLWAVLTLGRLFTTTVVVRAEQTVVTGGPYRFVRHPSYLGVLILLCGLGLALGDLAGAVATVVLPTMGLLWRIKVEEAALRSELGDRYIEYCKGHARLIPGIW
jgi:protein-S-isoprenylcysteine O-methyltransferase Ste14